MGCRIIEGGGRRWGYAPLRLVVTGEVGVWVGAVTQASRQIGAQMSSRGTVDLDVVCWEQGKYKVHGETPLSSDRV